MTSTGEAVLFWIMGPLMVIAALGLLFARRPCTPRCVSRS